MSSPCGALMTCTASIYEPWLQIAQIPASCFVPCTNKDCSQSYPSWTYVMPFVPELGFPDLRQDVKPHTTKVPLNCWHSQTTTHAKLGSNCENDLIWVCSNKNSPATFQFSRALKYEENRVTDSSPDCIMAPLDDVTVQPGRITCSPSWILSHLCGASQSLDVIKLTWSDMYKKIKKSERHWFQCQCLRS